MSDVGTWAWAQRTHGRLSRRDELHLLRQGVAARLAQLPRSWRRQIPDPGAPHALPDAPDSGLARQAEEYARELCDPELYGHCIRTWLFAGLFARHDRVRHDEELLYVACVLHDLGLTEAHDHRDPTAACFAVEGARAAHQLLCASGAPEARADTVAQAITLHLNVSVPARLGVEAHLLSKGVTLDAVGRRADRLPRNALAEVVGRWPREGFPQALAATTAQQAERRPRSRAALLQRLGFAQLVTSNPLDATR